MKTYETYKDSGIEWLGEIPGHWEVMKMKYLVNLQSGSNLTADQIKEEGQYPVYGGNGLRGFYHSFSDDGEYVLIGRQGALCGNINYAKGKFWATEHAVVCYPKQQFALTWFGELLRTMDLNHYSESAAQPGLSVEKIKQLHIPVPSLAEQEVIASYLDFKVGQIDLLIAEKEKQMQELQQYRMSLISEAVTRGLNPDAKMKDSGVEWLGMIPEHWEAIKLSRLYSGIGSGITPNTDSPDYYSDEGQNWLQTGDLNDGRISQTSKKITQVAIQKYKLRIYPIDSIVIAMYGATIAKLGILDIETTTNQACCVLPPTSILSCNYAFYTLYASKQCLISKSNGGGQPNISQKIIKGHTIPVPPLSEQLAIASFLDGKTSKIDTTLSELKSQIEDLRHYKSSVITEAVTGKVDVRQWKQT